MKLSYLLGVLFFYLAALLLFSKGERWLETCLGG